MKNTICFQLDEFINEYSAYVYKIIDNVVGETLSYEDKEEILSDTFYLFWKNQEKVNTSRKSYLGTIARNCSYLRLRKEKKEIPYDEKILYDSDENIEKVLIIKQKLEKLEKEELHLFELYYVYGYKVKEIAVKLQMHISTVKIRLYRLRKKLKEE